MGRYYVGSNINQIYYISHHGILGQKWGVRRYQNPDGSLTPAGRAKYREYEMKIQTKEKNWRDREINRVNKKYSIDKYNKKIEKAELKGKTVKAEVLKDRKEYQKSLMQSEIKRIKQMNIKDIRKENLKVGASFAAKAIAAGGLAALPVLKLTATPIFLAETAKMHFLGTALMSSIGSNKLATDAAWAGYNAASAKLFALNAAPGISAAGAGGIAGRIGTGGIKSRNRLTKEDYELARRRMNSRRN